MNKFKALFGAQDMTVGSPLKCLINFSIPLLTATWQSAV